MADDEHDYDDDEEAALPPRHRAWARLSLASQLRALVVLGALFAGLLLWYALGPGIDSGLLWMALVVAALWWAVRQGEAQARTPLEQAVLWALRADPRVNANLIIVRVEGRVAYLRGRQDTTEARDAAGEVAAGVTGIRGVTNEVEVLPSV
jgi:hypothetical protein